MSPPVPEPISEETLAWCERVASWEVGPPMIARLVARLRYLEQQIEKLDAAYDLEDDQLRAEVMALEQENAQFGARISLLSTLAIRALAEGWTLVQYERELTRLDALRETP